MEQRVEQKINEIQDYLEEFGTIMPASFEEYNSDLLKKAACERYFEKIMSSAESLALMILRNKQLPFPEADSAAYLVLSENMIIESELSQTNRSVFDFLATIPISVVRISLLSAPQP